MPGPPGSRGPPDLSPQQLVDRWLDKRRSDSSEQTISTYYYRLKLFVEWCQSEGIDRASELTTWDVESYEAHRQSQGVETNTLRNEIITLEQVLDYGARIGVVDDSVPENIEAPTVPQHAKSSDTLLTEDAAEALLDYHREHNHGSREHVLLELLWYTGARVGAISGLDLRDYDGEEQFVEFVHRTETDTPLKNAVDGQRPVGLPAEVCEAIDAYLQGARDDVTDDQGRQPLITSYLGRPTKGTLRGWVYEATVPCQHSPCPHGKDPDTCEWTHYDHASKCPSSRSPHQIRTGAITWMLNCGIPVEVVAERVNASIEVIQRHYDKAQALAEMERRRRPYLDDLGFEDDGDDDRDGAQADDQPDDSDSEP
jgi:site-specific recombinase XerD